MKKISIKTKVILFILINMFFIGIISNYLVTKILTKHFIDVRKSELLSVNKIKKDQISSYFKRIITNIQILSLDESLKNFIKDLEVECKIIKLNEKEKFQHKNSNIKKIYEKYENYFNKYISKYDYYDFFIIDPKNAHIIFTVMKENDLGESLRYGKLTQSGITKAYNKAVQYKRAVIVDMSLYSPSKDEPAMFAASPIFNNKNLVAVIAFQISDKEIINIMNERDGFGKIGETYLVGSDFLLRSNSYKDSLKYSIKSSLKNPNKINIKTKSVRNAFLGYSGIDVTTNYINEKVLSSYDLVSIDNFEWAIIAEIDMDEVLKANRSIRIFVSLLILFFSIIVSIVSFFLIDYILIKPINSFARGLLSFFDFLNYETNRPQKIIIKSKDEFALMANLLNQGIKTVEENIIKEKEVEKKLIQQETQKIAAQKANIAKSEFLNTMSHEFRTPLHAIISFTNFGINKINTAEREKLLEYFQKIHKSSNRLLFLVNDLLDISKLEAGKMIFDFHFYDMKSIIENTLIEIEGLLSDKNLSVETKFMTNNTKSCMDYKKIEQVLLNLLSNALKFSPNNGKITITLEDALLDTKIAIKVSLQDNGIGIKKGSEEYIFNRFAQVKSNYMSGGTGLGLAICKEIINAHKGQIFAKNASSGGAVFIFLIPKEECNKKTDKIFDINSIL